MIKSPLEIILEAKKKNTISPSGNTDYTKDDEPEEEIEETEDEDAEVEPTDYTGEEPEGEDIDDEPETVESEEDGELEPNDYTGEDPDEETSEGEETGEVSDEDGDLEPNDYTGEDPDGEETSSDDDSEDPDSDGELEANDYTGDDPDSDDTSTDDTETDTSTDSTGVEQPSDEENEVQMKKELFEDYTALYDLVKEFINKLSSHTVSTIFVNKIMIQINKNLNDTRRSIWNHIMKDFDRMNYVQNLTKYNFYVENLRINIQMVDKVKDYVSKSETFK